MLGLVYALINQTVIHTLCTTGVVLDGITRSYTVWAVLKYVLNAVRITVLCDWPTYHKCQLVHCTLGTVYLEYGHGFLEKH